MKKCEHREWTEYEFAHDVSPDELGKIMSDFGSRGFAVEYSPSKDEFDAHEPLTYAVEATRYTCSCQSPETKPEGKRSKRR